MDTTADRAATADLIGTYIKRATASNPEVAELAMLLFDSMKRRHGDAWCDREHISTLSACLKQNIAERDRREVARDKIAEPPSCSGAEVTA